MRERTRSLSSKALVLLLMFASGCVALVLQVTWMRELRLVFGATTASVAAVLAIFMGGIGAGSAFFGKRADASANPLRMYGLLEVAIAVTAIVSPWLIQMGSALYYCLGGQESLGVVSATIVRLLLAIVVMAIPTFLMGGTLPAAVRFATQSDDKQRAMLGLLYGSNTLGAVFGAAITTGYSLEILGTRATIWAGCVVGSCAGIVAIVFARYLPPPKEAADRSTPPKTSTSDAAVQSCDESPHELSISHALIYFAAAVLGGTFFALELVWYRMLGPILGGTAFTFGLILCVVLFGIGLGSIAYNFLFRRIQPSWSALSIVCGAEAAVAIVPYMVGDRIAFLAAWYTPTGVDFAARAMGWLFVASLVVLPVALVSGVQFPLLVAMLGQGREQVSSHVGRVYAWNTLGAIVGSLFAGFGGLPLLSAPGMWLGIAVLLSALSFVLLLRAPHITVKTIVPVTALALVTVNAIFMQGPTAAWRRGASGLGALTSQQLSQPNTVEASLREIRHGTILETDGIESSVQLANVNGLAFFVGGKCDGNALTDSATQVGMAILGAVLHDHPKTALVIGLGTGESAGWLAEMPGIEHVDVVELEPMIDEVASRCREFNFDVLHHPRVRLIHDDGREFVFSTSTKYDLILSEPSNPYRAGIAALYTSEFYDAVRNRLNPGGLLIQWLQGYQIDEAAVTTVMATVNNRFKHVEVWQTMGRDLHLVCCQSDLRYEAAQLRERIAAGVIRDALAKTWSVHDLEGFLSHFAIGAAWGQTIARSSFVQINTDDRTVLEYGFAKSSGAAVQFSINAIRQRYNDEAYRRPTISDNDVDWEAVELRRQLYSLLHDVDPAGPLLTTKEARDLARSCAYFRMGQFAAAIDSWPRSHRKPVDDIQRLILAACYANLGRVECFKLLDAEVDRHPNEVAALRGICHARQRQWPQATDAFDALFSRLAVDPWVLPIFVESSFPYVPFVVKADRSAAPRLYKKLSTPLAGDVFNSARQRLRVHVAEQIGPESVAEALAGYEPNVPWDREILTMRATAYAALHHPLAAQSQEDLDKFLSQQPSD